MLQDEECEICSPSSPPEICSPSTPETRAIATYADFLELYLSTPVWTRGETLPGPKLTSPVGKREDEGKKHGRNLWEFLKSTPWIRNFDARHSLFLCLFVSLSAVSHSKISLPPSYAHTDQQGRHTCPAHSLSLSLTHFFNPATSSILMNVVEMTQNWNGIGQMPYTCRPRC